MLGDMAVLTGGTVISEDLGLKLENLQLSQLGKAKQVKVNKDSTTIIQGAGKKADIQRRIDQLRRQIEETESEYDKEKFQERLAKLSGGVAVIKVGAATETELKEKKHRMEDALSATQAAVDEGIVAGGGIALVHVAKKLKAKPFDPRWSEAEKVGFDLVIRSLSEPLHQIAENAGISGDSVVEKVMNSKDPNWGYDALNDEWCDLMKAGIVDPVKVTRTALQKSASIAAIVLTARTLICEKLADSKNGNRPVIQ
jgi:chaperonin GroEL